MTKEQMECLLIGKLEEIREIMKIHDDFEAMDIAIFPDHIALFTIGGKKDELDCWTRKDGTIFHNAVKKEEAPKPEPESQEISTV